MTIFDRLNSIYGAARFQGANEGGAAGSGAGATNSGAGATGGAADTNTGNKAGANQGAAGGGGAGSGTGSGTGAGSAPAWRSMVTDPEALKEAERTTDLNAAFKRIADLRAQVGKAIVPPGKDAKPEEIAAYREKIGVPAKAEDYGVKVPDDLPENFKTEPQLRALNEVQALFHKHNLPKAAVDELMAWYWNGTKATVAQAIEADKQYAERTLEALKTKWPGEDYERNTTFAKRAQTEIFGDHLDGLRQLTDASGRFVLDHPVFIEALAGFGRRLGEGAIGPVITAQTRETLQSQADTARKNRDEALARGDRAAANKYDADERAILSKIHGTAGVAGAELRA